MPKPLYFRDVEYDVCGRCHHCKLTHHHCSACSDDDEYTCTRHDFILSAYDRSDGACLDFVVSGIDAECIRLVAALNNIRGIKTVESCCGHGVRPFSIWLEVLDMHGIHRLSKMLDRRYGGPSSDTNGMWHSEMCVELNFSDIRHTSLWLHSRHLLGDAAYRAADALAAQIENSLAS